MTKPRRRAWLPPDYTVQDIGALKALAQGIASEGQQKRALRWILDKACGRLDGTPFRSDADGGERETSFDLGRRFVADQIVKMVEFDNGAMEALKHGDGSS